MPMGGAVYDVAGNQVTTAAMRVTTDAPPAATGDGASPTPPPEADGGSPPVPAGRSLGERLADLADTSDGSFAEDGLGAHDPLDRVATFAPAILALRWGTTVASLALANHDLTNGQFTLTAWAIIIVAYAVFRTIRPLRYLGDVRSLLLVLGEVAMHVTALCMTGYWESPYILTVLTAISVAGFARGFGFSLRIGLVCSLAVSIPFLSAGVTDERLTLSAQWSLVLLLVALVAGYARRISGEADRQHHLALDRLGRLADANALLFSLHRVTQTLPASLDLNEVLDTTMGRLRGLFDFDSAAILAVDDTDGDWQVLRREGGTRISAKITEVDLPRPVRQAVAEGGVVNVADLAEAGVVGLNPKARSGLYAVLAARGSTIGLIALEDVGTNHFKSRDAEMLRGFVEPVALALDNARWFARLRTVGADEERTRIARDLHDRIGQSLAYLAFELDRIVANEHDGEAVGTSLERLRDDVRGVIREVRDTLYDLRTDVSDTQDMAATLEAFGSRIRERSSMQIELYCDRGERLPILQEREMWRIAQEALTNVERHSGASRVRILWRCNGESAALEVTDDGQGFPIGRAGRLDSYGILGMRERASSIGATLDLTSEPGKGTRVRCSLARTTAGMAAN
jgi:signal transduction histidine kinase